MNINSGHIGILTQQKQLNSWNWKNKNKTIENKKKRSVSGEYTSIGFRWLYEQQKPNKMLYFVFQLDFVFSQIWPHLHIWLRQTTEKMTVWRHSTVLSKCAIGCATVRFSFVMHFFDKGNYHVKPLHHLLHITEILFTVISDSCLINFILHSFQLLCLLFLNPAKCSEHESEHGGLLFRALVGCLGIFYLFPVSAEFEQWMRTVGALIQT